MKKEKKRGGCLKNILIGFVILIVLGSCAAIFGDDTEPEEKESSNPRSEVTDEEKAEMKQEYDDKKAAEEKAEEERIAKEDAEKQKEEEETPLTAAEEIENIIADVVGKDKITELNVEEADGSYEVDLTYAASENFTTNMTASGIKRNMVDIALKLQES